MALLDDNIKTQVGDILAKLEGPVKLVVFTQGEGNAIECDMCIETRQLAEEVAALSDQIEIEVLDFVGDEKRAGEYKIDKIPAIAILKGGDPPVDYGIRLYGIPSGYEFSSLLEDILMVGRGTALLSERTRKEIQRLDRPVHIQVYVTPT